MNVSTLFYFLIVNSIAGTIAWTIWKIFMFVGGSRMMKYGYNFLRALMIFWIFPFVLFMREVRHTDELFTYLKGTWEAFHRNTRMLISGILAVWIICSLIQILRHLARYLEFRRSLAINIPAERDEEEILREMEERLGMKRKAVLYRNEDYASSFTGWEFPFRQFIVIPSRQYGEEQLRQVFAHELIHGKKGDLLTRRIMLIIWIFHFMNPVAYRMYQDVVLWSEIDCDIHVCETGFPRKDYCLLLLSEMLCEGNRRYWVNAGFGDSRPQMDRRIRTLSSYAGDKQLKRGTAVLVGFVMILLSTANVAAAGYFETRTQYSAFNIGWQENLEGQSTWAEYEEFCEPIDWDGRTPVSQDTEADLCSGSWSGTWHVPSYGIYTKSLGTLAVGEDITVAVDVEAGAKIGILHGSSKRYVISAGSRVIHTFAITEAGTYTFFVDNPTGNSMTATIVILY